MPRLVCSVVVPASPRAAFKLLHDYDRRLTWDPFLREARILGPERAGLGVKTLCSAKWMLGGLSMETEYIAFEPGRVAAVVMTGRTPFFRRFAASIRHRALDTAGSEVCYTLSFLGRPRVLEPLMARVLLRETRGRLEALSRALADQ